LRQNAPQDKAFGKKSMASSAPRARAPHIASASARAIKGQLVGEIMPFWLAKGWDKRRGGFHERLFFDTTPDSLMVRRTRTQFRQINAFALAAELGWREGIKLAFCGLEFMIERAWAPDGKPGFVHVLAPDGSPTELTRDPSDHAAAIHALATLARVSDDAQVTGMLRLLISYVESALMEREGFLKPDTSGDLPTYPLNSYLHLFEALLAAHEQVEVPHALARAQRIRRQIETRFLDDESGMLPEFLNPAYTALFESEAFLVSPGLMAYTAGLIRQFERVSGGASAPLATHLLGSALRACAPATGFLLESIDSAGTVHESHTRLWAQCALVQGWLAQAESGVEGAREAGEALLENVSARFLAGPFPGGWIDRLDAQGSPAIDTVPASSLNALVGMAVAANPKAR
jgi:mannose/cellobiose epimerase-like protein (N-acyl-D-glucosamine 2-epimerase family)